MNFDFTDEQKQVAESVRRYLDKCGGITRARGVFEGDAIFDVELWRGMAELGCLGSSIPEEYGGFDAGDLTLCVVNRELGRSLAPIPFGSSICLFAEFLKSAASEGQKRALLPRIADGSAIGTVVLNADVHFFNGRLSGILIPVADGLAADWIVVQAKNGALRLVDLRQPSITRTPVATMDPSGKWARLVLREAKSEPLDSSFDVEQLLDRAAVLIAFQQIGGAEAALDMACDYAKSRFAFGRPIGSFQAIKQLLADCYVSLQLARGNAWYAAWALSASAPDLALAAARARVAATQAFVQCASECIQVHGGMGFTWQFDCHLFYRRATVLSLELGGFSSWERKLVDRLMSERHINRA